MIVVGQVLVWLKTMKYRIFKVSYVPFICEVLILILVDQFHGSSTW